MFFFVKTVYTTPEPSRVCSFSIPYSNTKNDIISPLKNNPSKLQIKSSSLSQIDLVSCTDLDCQYWSASIGTIKQHWIQYEYINSKAKITK